MDYKKVAEEVIEAIGGKDNVDSAAHCATRLRLVLKDEDLSDKSAVENIDGVKGAFVNSGQFQIIIGQGSVNKVYAEFIKIANISEASKGEVKRAAMKNLNPAQRFARTLSNIFVPIIPAIVASGLLMGLLGMMTTYGWVDSDSGLITLLDMFSNAAFVFLPVIVAFSAAKEFNANPYLASVLGAIMIHPALQNAWTLGEGIEQSIEVFGMQVGMVGYQGTVLPILVAVWFLGYVERSFRKIVPDALDIILTPFLTILTTGFISLVGIGPIMRLIGDGISASLQGIYETTGILAGLIFGGLYSTIVISGVHHSFHAIEAGLISEVGINLFLPIWAMANTAQGGAALAVYFMTNKPKMKAIALPAATSCLLGITEAAIFGVNLRLVKPFIAAALGGSIGGAYVVFTNVGMTALGLTALPGMSIVESGSLLNYIIGMLLAFGGAFIFTWIIGFEEEPAAEAVVEDNNLDIETAEKVEEADSKTGAVQNSKNKEKKNEKLVSPIQGEVVELTEVPDPTFAQKILGEGIAFKPEKGEVRAPVEAEVVNLFDTKHAVGLKTKSGVEILIHIGLDTVQMGGEGFEAFIKEGDTVKAGDKLISVDLELVEEKAESIITPMVITNTADFPEISSLAAGQIDFGDEVLEIKV
ncbi:PTS system beta-glucosides-specific IIC component/PTS system sucrose-specific IIC component [Halanaerobium saccharolyticum]|jgi:PTS system beta-glucosides-specific IIC component/PTS system sucrose-specific IIC component|uniref:PTS system beta-glucosides-specific IIC component/PTS system sucrose-specific IIC component n=1 Tax=Halanaerobium saccharolyticum TaxID=43595 RepID=A0A2T5RHS5_9FIRM|nr:sucrose-specific PTS transporter subunit IIBC [Halanaerobium saccharolyticum]OEG62928.1 MAG: PTS beta-glucoside transporter subunit EIIBCA [Halanaerobium sp. MDAL1]PTV96758.1 PTS system beta-glucosides-specific IIC component/PTS system sucrose-specific IIC component [Halanaerobium saccharolyticum]